MNAEERISKAVERINDSREQDAVHRTEVCLSEIIHQQGIIAKANAKIAEAQKELREIAVESVDASSLMPPSIHPEPL
jgi:hypothetical protein